MSTPTWPDRTWVTTAELAAIAGVAEKTVYREVKRGNLTAERAGGGRAPFIIDRPEAERWLAAYRKENDPDPPALLNPPATGMVTVPSS